MFLVHPPFFPPQNNFTTFDIGKILISFAHFLFRDLQECRTQKLDFEYFFKMELFFKKYLTLSTSKTLQTIYNRKKIFLLSRQLFFIFGIQSIKWLTPSYPLCICTPHKPLLPTPLYSDANENIKRICQKVGQPAITLLPLTSHVSYIVCPPLFPLPPYIILEGRSE